MEKWVYIVEIRKGLFPKRGGYRIIDQEQYFYLDYNTAEKEWNHYKTIYPDKAVMIYSKPLKG